MDSNYLGPVAANNLFIKFSSIYTVSIRCQGIVSSREGYNTIQQAVMKNVKRFMQSLRKNLTKYYILKIFRKKKIEKCEEILER